MFTPTAPSTGLRNICYQVHGPVGDVEHGKQDGEYDSGYDVYEMGAMRRIGTKTVERRVGVLSREYGIAAVLCSGIVGDL